MSATRENEGADPEVGEDTEFAEPELFELSVSMPPGQSHNPPPPPSLRPRADNVVTDRPGLSLDLERTPRLVRDLMSRKVFTIEPDATLEHLEEYMEAYGIRHLPVVEGHKLVGLITRGDLLHASSSFLSDRAQERDAIIHKVAASRIMQRELITANPNDRLSDVAALMWEAKIGCVPVVETEDRLVGIVTTADFVRLAHHFLLAGERAEGEFTAARVAGAVEE